MRFLLANVNTVNRRHEQLIALVRRERPEVVVVLEVNQRWLDALDELKPEYPYWVARPRPDNFGIALLSRRPLKQPRIVDWGSGVPSVLAEIELLGTWTTVVGTHPLPPVGGRQWALRNRQMSAMSQALTERKGRVVLLGDLNATPWTPAFRELLGRAGLRDTRLGFGIPPTWPTGLAALAIPIDHVLVRGDFQVCDRRVGPGIGSDHFPVIIDLGG